MDSHWLYNERSQEQQVSSIGMIFLKIVSLETKFEKSSSLGNLTIKGFFFVEKKGVFQRERKRMETYS